MPTFPVDLLFSDIMARKKPVKTPAAPAKGAAAVAAAPVEVKKAIPGASVGIDFGTHGVSIAAYKNDTFDLIVNDNGERVTPLYVSFTDLERMIGAPAKEAAVRNASNTVNYIRSYLGTSTAELAAFLKTNTSYTVVDGPDGKAAFQVKVKGENVIASPDELITLFAERLKKYADNHWDCTVTNAVLSVPVNFTASARDALIAAVEKAGFNVIATLADPVAAALSFHLDAPSEVAYKLNGTVATPIEVFTGNKKTILVADVGCIESSLTLLTSENGVLNVVDSNAANVSGVTLDEKLYEHFSKQFNAENNCDLSESKRATMRLMQACEAVKRNLSLAPQASIQLDALFEGTDYFTDITRTRFEMMCLPVFDTFNKQLSDLFARSHGIAPKDVTHIILAGGTAALTKFSTNMAAFFRKAADGYVPTVLKHVNTSDTVAFGAAKQAYLMTIADLETAETNKDAIVAAVTKAGTAPAANSNTSTHTTETAFNKPTVVLSKNLYVKNFYGTLMPLIGTNTSAPSQNAVRLAVPTNVPAGFSAAVAIYQTAADNAVSAAKADDLTCVGVFALNQNMIASAANTPEGVVPVTATIKATLTVDFKLTVEAAYTSTAVRTMTFSTLFSADLLSKTPVAPTKVTSTHSNADVHAVSVLNGVALVQQLVAQWGQWKANPKNKAYAEKHTHMAVPIANADKVVASVASIVNLPNPFNAGALTQSAVEYYKAHLGSLPSVSSLEDKAVALRDAFIRVIKSKGMTAAESKKYNDVLINGETKVEAAAAAPEAADDLDADVDFNDFSAGSDVDDDGDVDVDYDFDTGSLDGGDDEDAEEGFDLDAGLD